MHKSDIQLHEANSLAEASSLLREHGSQARLMAGGTDLLVDLKMAKTEVSHLVSIGGLEELKGLESSGGGLRIGALTTIATLLRSSSLSGALLALKDAASQMAAPQIRNMASVGGNVANAVPSADLPPVFSVLGAKVAVSGTGGERELPIDDLFVGPRKTSLQACEILTAIDVPAPAPRTGAAYERFSLRQGNSIAVAAVAAAVTLDTDGVVTDAKICLGAVAPIPKPVPDAAAALVGKTVEAGAAEASLAAIAAASPISDIRGSAEYRKDVIGVLTKRALERAAARAQGAQGGAA